MDRICMKAMIQNGNSISGLAAIVFNDDFKRFIGSFLGIFEAIFFEILLIFDISYITAR